MQMPWKGVPSRQPGPCSRCMLGVFQHHIKEASGSAAAAGEEQEWRSE